MPNDNSQNQDQTNPNASIGPAPIPSLNETPIPVPGINLPPAVVVDNKPKKFHLNPQGRKFVAAIFGLLLLVGGVAAGLILTQQKQEIREKAATKDVAGPGEMCGGIEGIICTSGYICIYDNGGTTAPYPDASGTCQLPAQKEKTSTPESIISCREVNAYKVSGDINDAGNWKKLTSTELGQLSSGDAIYLTVRGQSTNTQLGGGFTEAQFTINNGTPVKSTNVKPRTSLDGNFHEFYLRYEIPTSTNSFTVNAKLYHPSLGWI